MFVIFVFMLCEILWISSYFWINYISRLPFAFQLALNCACRCHRCWRSRHSSPSLLYVMECWKRFVCLCAKNNIITALRLLEYFDLSLSESLFRRFATKLAAKFRSKENEWIWNSYVWWNKCKIETHIHNKRTEIWSMERNSVQMPRIFEFAEGQQLRNTTWKLIWH